MMQNQLKKSFQRKVSTNNTALHIKRMHKCMETTNEKCFTEKKSWEIATEMYMYHVDVLVLIDKTDTKKKVFQKLNELRNT